MQTINFLLKKKQFYEIQFLEIADYLFHDQTKIINQTIKQERPKIPNAINHIGSKPHPNSPLFDLSYLCQFNPTQQELE